MKLLCDMMQVNRSGYSRYQCCCDGPKTQEDNVLTLEVKAIAQRTHNSYGSRRMAKALQAKGHAIGRYKARRLMQMAGVECKQRRRYRITTKSDNTLPIAKNLVNREFTVKRPNKTWVADITFLWTQEGWLYVAAIADLFSRRIVGWSMAPHMRETLVHEALAMALGRRCPEKGLLHHSDRGSQYASGDYQRLLSDSGMLVSMSRKGNCWDNAVMERFFGSLKSEWTEGKNYLTRKEAKADVIEYIEMFYNAERLHSTLGYVSPVQFEIMNEFLL